MLWLRRALGQRRDRGHLGLPGLRMLGTAFCGSREDTAPSVTDRRFARLRELQGNNVAEIYT
jgi:hypothetical protein